MHELILISTLVYGIYIVYLTAFQGGQMKCQYSKFCFMNYEWVTSISRTSTESIANTPTFMTNGLRGEPDLNIDDGWRENGDPYSHSYIMNTV